MGAGEGSLGGALAGPSNTGTSPRSPSTSPHAPHQFQSNTSPLSKWSSPTTSPSNGPFKRRKIDWKGKGRALDGEGDYGDDGMALPPVILALDVDCFYAQACRIRDPTLNGIPLGVQQKTILAAVSYEARAVGVPKIVSMREALRILPSLTIVNGEDLSFFRLLSNRSWRLLRSLVWGERVEKCGMDELWADVTETVDDHLLRCEMEMVNRDEELGTFLSFDQLPLERMQPVDLTRGFWYRPSDPIPGYFQPDPHSFSKSWPEDPWRQRYALGSHITYFFRRIIREQVNLECSGGVSFSKQMAKLIGSANKPAKQTCFCPAQPLESPHVSRADFHRQFLQDAQEYIDPLELGKLNGFGHVYVKKLEEIQQQGQHPASCISADTITATTAPREESHSHADWLNGHLDSVKSKHRLTVQKTRTNFSLPQFTSLFGPTIGPRLWSILHAIDTEPVAIASDFAAQQISIEDTYRNLPAGTACVNEMRKLGEGLMKRLEVECVEMPDEAWVLAVRASSRQRAVMETVVVGLGEEHGGGGGGGGSVGKEEKVLTQVRNYVDVEDEEQEEEKKEAGAHAISNGKESSNAPKLKTWRRYPLSVRLSLRIGWGARFSKTGKMPIGVFDLTQPRKKRAEILLSTLVSLFRQMTAGRDISEGFNLINIAALELSKSPPASHDIKNLLSKASSMYGGGGGLNGSLGRFPQRGGDEVGARSGSAVGPNIAAPVPQPAIDLEVLKDLPPDIAAEVAQEYGIPWPPAEPPPPIHTPSLATDPFQQSSPQDDEWPDLPSTPPFLSQRSSPYSPPQQMTSSASLSPTPSFMSYPPSQLSAQSFSPPPIPRVRLKSRTPSSPAVEDPVIASEAGGYEEEVICSDSPSPQPRPEAAADTPQSRPSTRFGHFELSSYDPPSQPKRLLDAGISTQQHQHPLCPSSTQRFGHFELSGCEMSVDELERFLSPPTPPPPLVADLGPPPPPVGAKEDVGTEVGLGVGTLSPPPAEPLPLPAPLLAPLMEGDSHLVVGGEVGLASQELGGNGAIPEQQGQGQEVFGVGAGDERDVAGGWERRACGQCGREMVIWLQHDHDVFGESGLPPGFEAEVGDNIRDER
ncbi:hypothetical protein CF319_g858 [Tilletia indica]|nr:hypothetical protein CF319_g858 [Tilletia indica]